MGELQDRHRADLASSGLTDATIAASGCYSAPAGETQRILGYKVHKYKIEPKKYSS